MLLRIPNLTRSLLLSLSLAIPVVGHAQVVRGTVRSGTGGPVTSVLVELRDSASVLIARQLSSDSGTFRFVLPGRGRYELQVRRIGFARQTVAFTSSADETTVTMLLTPVAITLPPVTARELNRCRNGFTTGSATARLWESAVTSLLSAATTVSDSTLLFDVVPSTRRYTLPDVYLMDVALRDERVRDALPWSSLDPRNLAEFGYVRLVGRTLQYVAPDVEVLSSDAFLMSHCLQVRDDRLEEGLIGLAFSPTNQIRQADIRGVLWIDDVTQRLRAVDYTYVSIPLALVDTIAGGRVELTTLADGTQVPSRWTVRSPVPTKRFMDAVAYRGEALHRAGFPVAVRELDPPLQTSELQVTGSAVQRVQRVSGADTTLLWQRSPSVVNVRVEWTQNAVTMPAARAKVALAGSSREGETDLLGRVQFADLPDGDYFVEARSDLEALLGLAPRRQAVTVAAGATETLRLTVSSPADAVLAACGPDARGGVLAGRVRRYGRPVSDAAVSLWRLASDEYAVLEDLVLASSRTDAEGRYVLCGVPRGIPLTLAAVGPDGAAALQSGALPSSREGLPERVTERDLLITP